MFVRCHLIIACFLGIIVLNPFTLGGQNMRIEDHKGKIQLVGVITREALLEPPFNEWFSAVYQDYQPQKKILRNFKRKLRNYEIQAFFSTWCGDSRREVPRLLKILDKIHFPKERLHLVCLQQTPPLYKQSPNHEEWGQRIHHVPTIILRKGGKEMGRIIERPINLTLEEDMQQIILTPKEYQPHYSILLQLDKYLKEQPTAELRKMLDKVIQPYQAAVKKSRTLINYGSFLLYSGRVEQGVLVLEMNAEIFRDSLNAHVALSDAYNATGRFTQAAQSLRHALKIDPNNKEVLLKMKRTEESLLREQK